MKHYEVGKDEMLELGSIVIHAHISDSKYAANKFRI